MSKIVIPFTYNYLERACRLLAQYDLNYDIDVDDLIHLWGENKITLCYYFKDEIDGENAHNEVKKITGIVYPEYKQVMSFINNDFGIIDIPLKVRKAQEPRDFYYIEHEKMMGYSDGYGDFLNFRPKEDLCITDNEILKVYELFTGDTAIKVHLNSERHAKNREQLYMQAIRVLIDHPDECKGKRGVLTQEAWAAAIIAHFDDYGYPPINSKGAIIKHLREAMRITHLKK